MLEDNRNKRFRVAYITYDGAQFSSVERDITQRDLGRLLAEAPAYFQLCGLDVDAPRTRKGEPDKVERLEPFLISQAELLQEYERMEREGAANGN